MEVLDLLDSLLIVYEKVNHKAVFTCDEAKFICDMISGVPVKNLFLKDENSNYYVLLLPDYKRVNFKDLESILCVKHFSFGSENMLMELLGLVKGSVTPLGIINDKDNKVIVLIDKDLVGKKILCHPNVNTCTISLECSDLFRFIEFLEHNYILV